MTNRGSRNVEAASNAMIATLQRTTIRRGNADGLLTDQIDPFTADEAIIHMRYYLDQKLNPLLVLLLTGTDGNSEQKQNEKSKLQTRPNGPDRKKHPIQGVQQRLMLDLLRRVRRILHFQFGHVDLTKSNVYVEHGAARAKTLKTQQIGPTSALAESSDYSAQIGKAR